MKYLLVLALFISACTPSNPTIPNVPPGPDANLTKVAVALLDIAKSTGSLQSTVIGLNNQKLINDDNTKKILAICARVNTFTGQASNITRGQANLSPSQRGNIWTLLQPIISTFNTDMNTGLLGINDPNTRATVSTGLLAIQTILTTIQGVVQ